jgi:hypothetical protein
MRRPFTRSTKPPSTDVSPSNSSPSATKNGRRRDVVDDDADVLQAQDGHERPPAGSCGVSSSCS